MNCGSRQSGAGNGSGIPWHAAAICLAVTFWHAQAFAGESPYHVPPADGPYLVGLDNEPKPVPIRVKTLCHADELIAFSCTLQNRKLVSLCASADIGKDTGYLQYRYGKDRSSIELEYPKERVYPHNYFKQVCHQAPKGYASALSFWKGAYRYSLFLRKTAYDYPDIAGIVVDRDAKMVSFHQCANESILFTFNPGKPIDGFALANLGFSPTEDDISYADLGDDAFGLTGARALTIGSAKSPTETETQPDKGKSLWMPCP